MTGKRRKRRQALPYSCPVSPERQARLERQYNRDAMRQWAEETGIADKVLNLIVEMDKGIDLLTFAVILGQVGEQQLGKPSEDNQCEMSNFIRLLNGAS